MKCIGLMMSQLRIFSQVKSIGICGYSYLHQRAGVPNLLKLTLAGTLDLFGVFSLLSSALDHTATVPLFFLRQLFSGKHRQLTNKSEFPRRQQF